MSNSLYIELIYELNKSNYILLKLTYLFEELNFKLKFYSFDQGTRFNKLIIKSKLKLFSSRFTYLSAL